MAWFDRTICVAYDRAPRSNGNGAAQRLARDELHDDRAGFHGVVICATFGWFRAARALASRSKTGQTLGVVRHRVREYYLIATSRSRMVSRAWYTSPYPAGTER